MQKPAPADFDLLPAIAQRYSTVAFEDRDVSPETLKTLFEAARWAPSSYNDQPWSFVVASRNEPEEFQRMLKCLMEANQAWAKRAAVLAISVASLMSRRTGQPSRHAYHDVGLATAQLSVQAAALGLQVHLMGGFNAAQARAQYGVPENFEPVCALAIGYPGGLDAVDAATKERQMAPRARRPQSDFVFSGKYGQPR